MHYEGAALATGTFIGYAEVATLPGAVVVPYIEHVTPATGSAFTAVQSIVTRAAPVTATGTASPVKGHGAAKRGAAAVGGALTLAQVRVHGIAVVEATGVTGTAEVGTVAAHGHARARALAAAGLQGVGPVQGHGAAEWGLPAVAGTASVSAVQPHGGASVGAEAVLGSAVLVPARASAEVIAYAPAAEEGTSSVGPVAGHGGAVAAVHPLIAGLHSIGSVAAGPWVPWENPRLHTVLVSPALRFEEQVVALVVHDIKRTVAPDIAQPTLQVVEQKPVLVVVWATG